MKFNEMNDLGIGILLIFIGQLLIYIQTNGQFIWQSFRDNPMILAIVFGTLVSYLFILGQKYLVRYFDGTLWESRFIGFSVGMITFAILTYFIFDESITMKTGVSIIITLILVLIQIFWK